MPSRYEFSDYSSCWSLDFAKESSALRVLLGDDVIEVYHIGSTSVPSLAAKAVIDLLPVVCRIARMDELAPKLVAAGYRAWGEYGISGRRLFTKDRDDVRTHNLHFFAQENPEIERHLAFCAYLRNHPEVCREYEGLKRRAYARHPADIAAYCDFKDTWIQRVEPQAVQWYREQRL